MVYYWVSRAGGGNGRVALPAQALAAVRPDAAFRNLISPGILALGRAIGRRIAGSETPANWCR